MFVRECIQSVENAGNVTENRQQNADEELGPATSLEEDTERRKEDGEDDLDDVAVLSELAW